LQNNYSSLYSYTDITNQNVNTSNLENTFIGSSYQFFKLELEGANIDAVLSSDSLGKTLEFDFIDDNMESVALLKLDGIPYTMLRANECPGVPVFTPEPDRYFRNSLELCDNTKAVVSSTRSTINADTVANTQAADPMLAYTYAMMYIAATGRSLEVPPTTIYSQPTFVGIFKLPGTN
jgi:hypothetical protein